jgi:hypothetical protein
VADERTVDEHLGAVLDEVLDAVYQAKQAAWSAVGSPFRADLQDLVSFLIEQSGGVMQAEERIDGRAPGIGSPSSHQRGNIVGEAGGDITAAVALLVERLDAMGEDIRTRIAAMAGADEATILDDLVAGLEARLGRLRTR